jgi:hypothetical protein
MSDRTDKLTLAERPVRAFRMNDAEWEAVARFERHRCALPDKSQRLLTVTRKPTGVGDHFEVSCPCGKAKDVTDYGSW